MITTVLVLVGHVADEAHEKPCWSTRTSDKTTVQSVDRRYPQYSHCGRQYSPWTVQIHSTVTVGDKKQQSAGSCRWHSFETPVFHQPGA